MKTIGKPYPPTPITPEYTDGEVTFSMTFKEVAALHVVLACTSERTLHHNLTDEGAVLLHRVYDVTSQLVRTNGQLWTHATDIPDEYIDVIDYKGTARTCI